MVLFHLHSRKKRSLTLKIKDAAETPPGPHTHEVTLTPEEVELAMKGKPIKNLITATGAGHQHKIKTTKGR